MKMGICGLGVKVPFPFSRILWTLLTLIDAVSSGSKGKGKSDGRGLFGGVGQRKGVPPEKAEVSGDDPDAERKPLAPAADPAGQQPLYQTPQVVSPQVRPEGTILMLIMLLGSSNYDWDACWRGERL